ncbi:MAG: PAS domain S-box protein [Trueperaceae bacterium]|nr:MAG: PAS domain S-box protein [Trueperaceae bacterium]
MVTVVPSWPSSLVQTRAVLHHLAEGLLVLDLDGNVLYMNPAALQILETQYDEGESRFADYFDLFSVTDLHGRSISPEDWPLARVLRGEGVEREVLRVQIRASGVVKVLKFSGTLIREDTSFALLTFEDVTAQKAAESRFATAFRASPVPSVIARLPDGVVLSVNESFQELSCCESEGMLYRRLVELPCFVSRKTVDLILSDLHEGAKNVDYETQLASQTGTPRQVLVAAQAIEFDGSACGLLTFVDVTERRHMEQRLVDTINGVMQDFTTFHHAVIQNLSKLQIEDSGTEDVQRLTKRERAVLMQLATGRDNVAIADELNISCKTVRNYVTRINKKLGVGSRGEAIVWARKHGLLPLENISYPMVEFGR